MTFIDNFMWPYVESWWMCSVKHNKIFSLCMNEQHPTLSLSILQVNNKWQKYVNSTSLYLCMVQRVHLNQLLCSVVRALITFNPSKIPQCNANVREHRCSRCALTRNYMTFLYPFNRNCTSQLNKLNETWQTFEKTNVYFILCINTHC